MKSLRFLLIAIIAAASLSSCADVDPGQEGFYYRPYGDGIDSTEILTEGTHSCAIWNDVIRYDIRQQTREYKSSVMDKNGTEITLNVGVNFKLRNGESPNMHLRHGPEYRKNFVDVKVRGAIKDVVGRYTYEEVYSEKREYLETEIEDLLREEFFNNFLDMKFVEIADVNLPKNIAAEITNKETQKQRNFTAKEKKKEQTYLAEAKTAEALGDSAKRVINANAIAAEIRITQDQLTRSGDYIEYVKWKGYASSGESPYGTGNVFGSGVGILKNM